MQNIVANQMIVRNNYPTFFVKQLSMLKFGGRKRFKYPWPPSKKKHTIFFLGGGGEVKFFSERGLFLSPEVILTVNLLWG